MPAQETASLFACAAATSSAYIVDWPVSARAPTLNPFGPFHVIIRCDDIDSPLAGLLCQLVSANAVSLEPSRL